MIKAVGDFQSILNNADAIKWVNNKEEIIKGSDTKQSSSTKSFSDFFLNSMSKVNELQNEANVAVEKLATGQSQNLHETLMIVEQAEMAFKTMNQIRMKVLDAYKEVMRMQI